jgi:hypothetical protein
MCETGRMRNCRRPRVCWPWPSATSSQKRHRPLRDQFNCFAFSGDVVGAAREAAAVCRQLTPAAIRGSPMSFFVHGTPASRTADAQHRRLFSLTRPLGSFVLRRSRPVQRSDSSVAADRFRLCRVSLRVSSRFIGPCCVASPGLWGLPCRRHISPPYLYSGAAWTVSAGSLTFSFPSSNPGFSFSLMVFAHETKTSTQRKRGRAVCGFR